MVSLELTPPSPGENLPYTSRRVGLGASDVCLVGVKPTCSIPAW